MHVYSGVNPIAFVATSGSPGGVVSPQPTGNGTYSLPQVVDASDTRDPANLMAGIEANRDALNWVTWRLPDFISGGDYRSLFRPAVSIATQLFIDGSGVSRGGAPTLTVSGDAIGGPAIEAYGSASNSTGIQAYGHGFGYGIVSQSGTAGGAGILGEGYTGSSGYGGRFLGDGTAPGVLAVPGAGTSAAVLAHTGALSTDTNGPSGDPGVNMLWADLIPKCAGAGHTDGMGGVFLDWAVNCGAPTIVTGTGGKKCVNITFARNMYDGNYHATADLQPDAGSFLVSATTLLSDIALGHANAGFSIEGQYWNGSGYSAADPSAVAMHFSFVVFGRMT